MSRSATQTTSRYRTLYVTLYVMFNVTLYVITYLRDLLYKTECSYLNPKYDLTLNLTRYFWCLTPTVPQHNTVLRITYLCWLHRESVHVQNCVVVWGLRPLNKLLYLMRNLESIERWINTLVVLVILEKTLSLRVLHSSCLNTFSNLQSTTHEKLLMNLIV